MAACCFNKKIIRANSMLIFVIPGFTNGAILADNLVAMLFFWEGLLLVYCTDQPFRQQRSI